ncbi:MAG: ADP-glyceromanno-heptose 6-epimerase [Desulfovibrio sp.]|nr:ADP-glyceromanno-heptose 6-epimerase [Desulfovibrio sp.]
MLVVTGGAGFIGSVLLWQLNMAGRDDIIVVDHLGTSEKWRNLVKRRYADYLPRERFRELLLRNALPFSVSGIVHLGACSATTEQNSDFLMDNNYLYSQDLCRYAADHGIRMLVASSAATYGDGSLGFDDDPELISALRPLNMYGYSKQLLDLWLLRQGLSESIISLKFFNVYGPNEYHKGSMSSVVLKAHAEIRQRGRLSLFASNRQDLADGEQQRDFVYVKDCTALMAWLLENPEICGIHNVGTGQARTFNDLGRAVFAAMGRSPVIDYQPMPEKLKAHYQNYTCADMHWLEELSCPVSFVSLEQGVRDYVTQYLESPDPYV